MPVSMEPSRETSPIRTVNHPGPAPRLVKAKADASLVDQTERGALRYVVSKTKDSPLRASLAGCSERSRSRQGKGRYETDGF